MRFVIALFSILCGVALIGTLVDPEPIEKWRVYTIAILYAMGTFNALINGYDMLTSTKK